MPRKNGFTLIETLMASAVLMIFITAVLSIIHMSIQAMGEARIRSAAIQLAQDRLELARNLPYDRLGTVGGIPLGDLIQSEIVTRLGSTFKINTTVVYIDDPFDGTAPTDILPSDYKRVRISVSWSGAFTSKRPAVVMMDISPPGLESDNGGGTLSVLVFNSLGLPVENASVHIEAPSLSPPITIDTYTDVFGRVIIPGAPVCDSCYKVQVTKEGFTLEKTYDMAEVANPTHPHLTVIQAKVSEVSFAIDTLSTLIIRATRSKTSEYTPFVGANVTLKGTKEIGRTSDDEPVYKITRSVTTGSGGLVTVSNLDWDNYTVSVPSNSSVDFAGSWPFNPVSVTAGQSVQMNIIIEPASTHSYLVQIESSTQQPIASASAELTRPGYIATSSTGIQTAGDYSQAYFPSLTPATYTLMINALGYDTATSSVSISGDVIEKFIVSSP